MKNEKKVEKTKATLVREVEVKFKVNKGFFDSLEREQTKRQLLNYFPFSRQLLIVSEV